MYTHLSRGHFLTPTTHNRQQTTHQPDLRIRCLRRRINKRNMSILNYDKLLLSLLINQFIEATHLGYTISRNYRPAIKIQIFHLSKSCFKWEL